MANFARIRLILELHDRGMSQDEISRSRHMSRSTITTVL
jgi:orotate phosphoribosyltransferase-like protein